jgi:hypothetical protein
MDKGKQSNIGSLRLLTSGSQVRLLLGSKPLLKTKQLTSPKNGYLGEKTGTAAAAGTHPTRRFLPTELA